MNTRLCGEPPHGLGMAAFWLILVACLLGTLQAANLMVDQRHPQADDRGPASDESPLATIGEALNRAQPGDQIRVRPGLYRETLRPPRSGRPEAPIVISGEGPIDSVVISAREPWTARWSAVRGHAALRAMPLPEGGLLVPRNPFRIALATGPSVALPPARTPGNLEPLPLSLGQLAIGGRLYRQRQRLAEVAAEPGSWMVDASGSGLIFHPRSGDRPDSVEIAVRERCLAPARRHLTDIHLHNLTFVGAADQAPFPQRAMVGTGAGQRWRFTACTFREASAVGLDIGGETWIATDLPADDRTIRGSFGHRVLGCRFIDNGLTGLAGWLCRDAVIAGNLVQGNHTARVEKTGTITWEEWGGIKLHGTNARVIGNLVIGNHGPGIWLDNGYDESLVAGNLILDNLLGGVFLELGAGSCRVEHNLIAGVRPFGGFYPGDGIYCHDASGIEVIGNLVAGASGAAIRMRTISEREFANRPVETSDAVVLANQLIGNMRIEMPTAGPRARNNRIGENQVLPTTALGLRVDAERGTVRVTLAAPVQAIARPDSWSLIDASGQRHAAGAWQAAGPWPEGGRQRLELGPFPLDPALAEALAIQP